MIDYLSTFKQNIGIFVKIILHGQKVDQLGHFYPSFHHLGKLLFTDEDRNAGRYGAIESLPSGIIKDGIFGHRTRPFRF